MSPARLAAVRTARVREMSCVGWRLCVREHRHAAHRAGPFGAADRPRAHPSRAVPPRTQPETLHMAYRTRIFLAVLGIAVLSLAGAAFATNPNGLTSTTPVRGLLGQV